MNRPLSALAAAVLFTVVSPAATAQSTGLDRAHWDVEASGRRECNAASMARCWYMFFASNETPYRQLWMADLKVRKPEPRNANLIEIDVVQMHEGDDPKVKGSDDFLLHTLQFKCEEKKYRVAGGFALTLDGSIQQSTGTTDWGGYEDTWVGLAGKIACEKSVQLSPANHSMVFLGDFYRPVDAVDVTRGILWKQGRQPSGAGSAPKAAAAAAEHQLLWMATALSPSNSNMDIGIAATEAAAKADSIKNCAASDCIVILSFQGDSCTAFGSGKNAAGQSLVFLKNAPTEQAAKSKTIDSCKSFGAKGCEIHMSQCHDLTP